MTPNRLSSRLLNWYRLHKRTLPWRGHPDPYAVWVSEIMLQQTRVETVIPYFEKWMHLFPTVTALAEASEQSVLNAWEGLGYYSRARNLHKAAQLIVSQHNGELPRDLDELRKLPGIGRYTLGAIASIAFDMSVPALDGNIKRVYARVFDISEPVDSPGGEKILWELVEKQLPKKEAGDHNQALMDLGASICIPKNPRCLICPLMRVCKARQNGTQNERPVKMPKKNVPHHVHVAGLMIRRGRVLLARRPSKGLLGGMWEFPNGRVAPQGAVNGDPLEALADALRTGYNLRLRKQGEVQKKDPLGIVHHGYSHFTVSVHVYACMLDAMPKTENLKWVSLKDLNEYPMGRIDRQIADLLAQLHDS
ncbi:MAG: A/G-specific adenine glycosylase [Chloroflexota bacterium]